MPGRLWASRVVDTGELSEVYRGFVIEVTAMRSVWTLEDHSTQSFSVSYLVRSEGMSAPLSAGIIVGNFPSLEEAKSAARVRGRAWIDDKHPVEG